MDNSNSVSYREVQQFRQSWVMAIVIGAVFISTFAMIKQLIFNIPFGENPSPDWAILITWILVGFGLPYIFYTSKLITEVRSDGIYFRYIPFHFSYRKIKLNEIESFEKITYRPIMEYGGWGIRSGKKSIAYNVSGNEGVMIKLNNGKNMLIGSQKPEELEYAIRVKKNNEKK